MQFPLLMSHPLMKSNSLALLNHDASERSSERTASCFLS